MEDKLPNFLKELDTFVRDWDNAFIDYQLAVVRFRWRESVNMINIYNPPQTVEQVRKIVRLPCEGDEALLDAVVEGVRRLKLRPNAQPHFILVTDEPAKGEYSPAAIIRMLQDNMYVLALSAPLTISKSSWQHRPGAFGTPSQAGKKQISHTGKELGV